MWLFATVHSQQIQQSQIRCIAFSVVTALDVYLAAVLRLNQILRLNSKFFSIFHLLLCRVGLGSYLFQSTVPNLILGYCYDRWLPHVWQVQVGDCITAKPLESQKWRLPSVLLGTPAICILHQCECYFNTKRAFPDQGPVVEGIKIASQPVHGKSRTRSQSQHQLLKTLR